MNKLQKWSTQSIATYAVTMAAAYAISYAAVEYVVKPFFAPTEIRMVDLNNDGRNDQIVTQRNGEKTAFIYDAGNNQFVRSDKYIETLEANAETEIRDTYNNMRKETNLQVTIRENKLRQNIDTIVANIAKQSETNK